MFRKVRFLLAYLLFPIGAVTFSIAVLIPAFLVGVTERQRRRVTAFAIKVYLWLLRILGLCSIEVVGEPSALASVTVYNHPTLFDALIAITHQPTACCVVKDRVSKSPIYGVAAKLLGYITAENGMAVVEKGVVELANGSPVIIFPEGTRVVSGLGKLHRSAARLALQAQAPISIGVISCDPPVLNRSSKLFRTPDRKVNISIRYLPTIQPEDGPEPIGIRSRMLTEAIERALLEHVK